MQICRCASAEKVYIVKCSFKGHLLSAFTCSLLSPHPSPPIPPQPCPSSSTLPSSTLPFLIHPSFLNMALQPYFPPHVAQSYSEGTVKSPIAALADATCVAGSTQPSVPGGCVVRGSSTPLSVETLDSLCLYPKFRLAL